jgi:glutathione synthase/RimK-type ligase-like ATP-grasp enzyme
MKTIYIRGDKSESADILQEHLEERRHRVVRSKDKDYDVIVCWGMSNRDHGVKDVPTLNANVNLFDKYQSLKKFKKAGVHIPTVFSAMDAVDHIGEVDFPWFARKVYHEKGNDIIVCKTEDDVTSVLKARQADFFSVYEPHEMELRAWVFNGEVFAVYHKQYRNHGLMNFKNLELRSELRDDLLRDRRIVDGALPAVKALKLDFGGVDILRNERGNCFTLEVNSMPQISSLIRVNGIRLAQNISRWAEAQR